MGRFFGKPALAYTDDSTQLRVVQLDAPLRHIKLGHSLATYTRESLDRSRVEYYTVSSGAYEVKGTVRFSQDGHGLIDLLKAGSQGKTLTYYPNMNDSDVSVAMQLLSPLGDAGIDPDPQRPHFGEYSVELRLRTTDGTLWDQPFDQDTNLLFRYKAGDSLKKATFTRNTSPTTPAFYAAPPVFGTLTSAKDEQARLHWVSTASNGPRDTPTLLLEGARTNWLTYSEDFSQWTNAGVTASGSQSDPLGGTAAWWLEADSTSSAENRNIATTTIANPATLSLFVKESTAGSTAGVMFGLRDESSGPTYRARCWVTWSSGVPSQGIGSGSSLGPPERYRDGWYRFQVRTTTEVNVADTHNFYIYPAISTSNAPSTGSAYFFGAQVE